MSEVRTVYELRASRYPMTTQHTRRTDARWRSDATQAQSSAEKHLKGIKGPCDLMRLPYVHMNEIAPLEMMHSQLIGTMKLLLQAWTGKIQDFPQVLSNNDLKRFDSKTSALKFPCNTLRRFPKILSKTKWKAIDYSNFIYYATPILEQFLPKAIFDYFSHFVRIMTLLNAAEITLADLALADQLVKNFIDDFPTHYPTVRLHRYVVHTLLHLPDTVRKYGPLHLISAFLVENEMGNLARKVVTATNVQQQVYRKSLVETAVRTIIHTDNRIFSDQFYQHAADHFQANFQYHDSAVLQMPEEFDRRILTDHEKTVLKSGSKVRKSMKKSFLKREHFFSAILVRLL